jgi:hypothetical protein
MKSFQSNKDNCETEWLFSVQTFAEVSDLKVVMLGKDELLDKAPGRHNQRQEFCGFCCYLQTKRG